MLGSLTRNKKAYNDLEVFISPGFGGPNDAALRGKVPAPQLALAIP